MGLTRRSRRIEKHVQHMGRIVTGSCGSTPVMHETHCLLRHPPAVTYHWALLTSTQLLLAADEPSLWAMCDHPPAPTYTKGRVVMMGDAAHATTPYQGQGASQAIEDALVLATVLAEASDPRMIPNAYLAFDQVRRVRTQRVVSTSRDAGQLASMKAEGVGSDLEKMRELLSVRGHWIWNRNLLEQNREALRLFRESF